MRNWDFYNVYLAEMTADRFSIAFLIDHSIP